jgi:hypothetical protein
MNRTHVSLLVIAMMCAGCLDFVEPEACERPSDVAEVTLSASQENDSTIQISGAMVPGYDECGTSRPVLREDLIVFGVLVPPDTVIGGHIRGYTARLVLDDSTRHVFTVDPPPIAGLSSRPTVEWFGIRRVGGDTLWLEPGEDLVLHIEFVAGSPRPEPPSRRWALGWSSGQQPFQIFAEGLPPETLRVPAQYLSPGSLTPVTLYYSQSGSVTTPGYWARYHYATNISWTAIVP